MGPGTSHSTSVFPDVLGVVLFTVLTMTQDFVYSDLPNLDLKYYKDFLPNEEAGHYFQRLIENLDWKQYNIKIFGKSIPQPRLTALYAETGKAYRYSGLTLEPLPYSAELKTLQKKLELVTNIHFTHCLANLYRDGQDSMSLHADDEKELGIAPVIASLSFGETRRFRLKHKYDKNHRLDLYLEPGSLLIMQGKTQHFWKHELPKTTQTKGARINLTFRKILN